MRRHFTSSFVLLVLGLILAGVLGWIWRPEHPIHGAISAVILCGMLCMLEISISFDNALVNATVVKRMNDKWRHRFLTWGMLIAVFGMRIVFPLLIVGVIAWIGPIEALVMALREPQRYAEIMRSVHTPVVGFGGAFLLMVALKHFINHDKSDHWIDPIEKVLAKLGRFPGVDVLITLLVIGAIGAVLHARQETEHAYHFWVAAAIGLVTHLAVSGLSSLLTKGDHGKSGNLPRAGASLFIYLEIQDASFSFDSVVGAFAVTDNLFFIAIGLGIGAMFVRSLTLFLVEHGTMSRYRYIEPGAFYAIGALAMTMLLSAIHEMGELVPGLLSMGIIVISLIASIRHNRQMGR